MTIKVFAFRDAYAVTVNRVPVAMYMRLTDARRAAMERAISARKTGETVSLEGVVG